MRLVQIILAGLALCWNHAAALAQTDTAPAAITITLEPDASGPVINRDIFGQFAEMLGEGINGGVWVGPDSKIPNVRGIRKDVVAALRELKVPNVRWPGGCFADEYNWRDGIGPQAQRVSHINQWGNVIEPNAFGTHEFMDFVEQIGSEAFISVNVGRGAPEQAADWLEYMTVDQPTTLGKQRAANGRKQPWRIKYLGLGNENWGCGGGMSADGYVEKMKVFGTFTKSFHPDQSFKYLDNARFPMMKVAVGETLGKTAYTEAVMKAWQAKAPFSWDIAALSLHYYTGEPQPLMGPSQDFGENDYAVSLKKTLLMDDMLAEHSAIMDRYDPERKVALSIDEWGMWWKPIGKEFFFLRQQNSIRDALGASLNLNIFARHADRVRVANIAQMVNVIQAMILTDGPKMLRTPTYHVFRMYVPFQDAKLVPVRFDAGKLKIGEVDLPRIDAIAARASDGSLWLALTNLDPLRPADLVLSGTAARSASGETLAADEVDAINTFDAPEAVSPKPVRFEARGGKLELQLAPLSVTMLRLDTN